MQVGHNDHIKLRSRSLDWRLVGGEVVVLDGASSQYLSVNGAGALLWPLIADGASTADLVGALVAEYGIDEEAAAGDVAAFVASLRDLGLVDDADGGPGASAV